ncbi:hypothetical protein D3C84_1296320 [compost metagenome]
MRNRTFALSNLVRNRHEALNARLKKAHDLIKLDLPYTWTLLYLKDMALGRDLTSQF